MCTESKDGSTADTVDLFAGLFTWCKLLGRHSGVVARLCAAGCSTREVAEIAACEGELQCEWGCFAPWADAVGESLGFEYRAMCRERCAVDSDKGKIHLQRFVCSSQASSTQGGFP